MTNALLLKNEIVLRKIPENKKGVCLFSGGKDCGLALSIVHDIADVTALITCCKDDHPLFHQQCKSVMTLQAEALGIPITHVDGHWKDSRELHKLLSQYKNEGIEFVLFGSINNVKNANRIIALCDSLNLIPCMPLWNIPYLELMNEIKKRRLRCILTSVRPMIKEYLGKEFNSNVYTSFLELGIDPFGENGEFHSTLLDLDIFKFPIQYENIDICHISDKFGEKIETITAYYK